MRLKAMLVLALLATVFSAFGAQVVLLPLEDFNTGPFPPPLPPDGWAQGPPHVGAWDWEYGPDLWFGGTPADSCVSVHFDAAPSADTLFTPVFDASGLFDSIVVDFMEDYDTVFGGLSDCHILISTDSGATWHAANVGLTDIDVQCLTIDPVNPSTVYAGTDIGGIFKSTNGGGNWTAINNALTNVGVPSLAIDPLKLATVYAGTNVSGVMKSLNGGGDWSSVNSGLMSKYVHCLAVDHDADVPRAIEVILLPITAADPAAVAVGGQEL